MRPSSAFPALSRKGTPSHRALFRKTAHAANVGVRLQGRDGGVLGDEQAPLM